MPAITHPPVITPDQLVTRLAGGEQTVVLDVRTDPSWSIQAASATVITIPAAEILGDPAAAAARLPERVVVVCNRGITAIEAAHALIGQGIDAAVLEGGMRGWIGALHAAPIEVPVDGVHVLQVQRPGRGCLSYVVTADGEALVVDPAPDAGYYVALADELGVKISTVLDTHLHADHISGARALGNITGAQLHLPAGALQRGISYANQVTAVADGDTLSLGGQTLQIVGLPGHTTDMTGVLIGDRVLIGGDSLFADGIARPDLQEGDPEGAREMARRLHATLNNRVLPLGDNAVLLPGHAHEGLSTGVVAPTLAQVRANVPELALTDPGEFAEALVHDMPPRPANYESIIAINSGHQPIDLELESGGNSCSAS